MTARLTRFGDLEIAYDDEVLEPRDWTIEQSRWAIDLLGKLPDGPVLELCAGAGQIGLVVGVATGRPLVQVDAEAQACAFARRNAEVNGAVADVRMAPMEEALTEEERFHLVLADPPYIPADEVEGHPGDPGGAIDGGADGLDLARSCLQVAAAHLLDDGLVLVQLGGPEQVEALSAEAGGFGLRAIESRSFGHDRALLLLAGVGEEFAALPVLDEHETTVAAGPNETWAALLETMGRPSSILPRGYARAVGCVPRAATGPRPLAEGSTIPGFLVEAAAAPSELVLRGRHRFSSYALTFRLEPLAGGGTRLRAETRATFPGAAGRAYRLLLQRTGGHVFGMRRLLAGIRARAEGPS